MEERKEGVMSQTSMIYQHLKTGKSLTALQALKLYGCLRCASRINEIRNDSNFIRSGKKIVTIMIEYGNKRVGQYRMI